MRTQEERGTMNKLKGRAKEALGIITGNKALEQKGAKQRTQGAVQETVGKARRKVSDLVGGVAKTIKK